MLHLVCVSVVERFANKGVEATVPHVNAKIADGVLTPHSFFLAHFLYTSSGAATNLLDRLYLVLLHPRISSFRTGQQSGPDDMFVKIV